MIFYPACRRGIPFEFAGGGGVLEILECGSDFAEERAEAFQKFFAVRADFCEFDAVDVGEEPDEAFGFIWRGDFGEKILTFVRDDAGELEIWRLVGEMLDGLALHVDEAAVAGGVHDFEDEFRAVVGGEVEIVVVLAGEWFRGGGETVEVASDCCGGFR